MISLAFKLAKWANKYWPNGRIHNFIVSLHREWRGKTMFR